MTDSDFSILKRNISMLMENEHMTQAALADILEMSQSNVSKCLNAYDDSRRFTLEQVIAIADYFGTSVDELIGRTGGDRKISPHEICAFFVSLFESRMVRAAEHLQRETIVAPQDPFHSETNMSEKDISYPVVYFPEYWLPDDSDPNIGDMDWAEIREYGNSLSKPKRINEFLRKYINAWQKYDAGEYSEEDYHILVDAYFKILG